MKTKARDAINRLPSYSFPDLDLPGTERVVVLAQNELALPPSPRAIEAARLSIDEVNRYSDIDQLDLRRAIAAAHALDLEHLICGAGSLELMSLMATAYCETGTEVVVSQYGYKFFQVLCSVAGADIRVVPEPGMQVDLDAIVDAVSERTRIVFLVNPGNPTGQRLPDRAIAQLRERIPESVMLIVDGAYAEFAGDDFESGFDLVDQGRNLVVLRTFSKAYGLAGMRVGWAYAPAEVVAALLKIRAPNSISTPGLAAAAAAVRDRRYLEYVRAEIIELRENFIAETTQMGFVALPSWTNFVLIECRDDQPIAAAQLERELRDRGIIVRAMGSYDLDRYLRVSIGSRAEMGLLSTALREILA